LPSAVRMWDNVGHGALPVAPTGLGGRVERAADLTELLTREVQIAHGGVDGPVAEQELEMMEVSAIRLDDVGREGVTQDVRGDGLVDACAAAGAAEALLDGVAADRLSGNRSRP